MVSRRAIVMEMSEKHLIVLTPTGEFRRVPRASITDVDIGDEIQLASRRKPIPRRAWAWTAAALVVLLLFPIVMVPTSKAAPIVAYVTLDVNPSVELGINDEEEVRELRGLNIEGKELASGIEYKGKHAAEVVASLVEKTNETASSITSEDHDIVIASVVVGDKLEDPDQFEAELESEIHEAVTKVVPSNDNVTVLSVPKEVREEAERSGVSTGKMAVYLMAKSKNPKVKLDSLKEQSIHDWTASEGGIQSVVPPKDEAAAAAATTPTAKAADSAADKETELKSKAASNKQAKEALKELLEREKRAKAKDKEKTKGGKHESNKPAASTPTGAGPAGLKQGEADTNKRPNTVKPGTDKGNSNGNGGINNRWNDSDRWNSNHPITNNNSNNGGRQGNNGSNNGKQTNSSSNWNDNSKDEEDSKNNSKGSSSSSRNTKSNDNKSSSKDNDNNKNSSKNTSSNNSKDNNSNSDKNDKGQSSSGNNRNNSQSSSHYNDRD